MTRRILAILLAAALLLSTCGCLSVIEHDYSLASPHPSAPSPSVTPEGPVFEAATYSQLYTAVLDLIRAHENFGTVRLSGYEGNAETDVAAVCMDIANNTPLGAYAVYYITSSVSRIVSYYEAKIEITYKRTANETDSVISVKSADALREMIRGAVCNYSYTLTVATDTSDISEAFITSTVDELYYSDPMLSVTHPSVSVVSYPQTGLDRIIEIKFAYTYLKTSLVSMHERLSESAAAITDGAPSGDDAKKLLYIAEALAAGVELRENTWDGGEYDKLGTENTAYGALVRSSATSEGFAMAVKLLCDRLGIENIIVRGRLGSLDRSWNLVALGDEWYHVDVYLCAAEGFAKGFLKNDESMSAEYLWDAEKYPKADGTMTYSDLVPPPAAEASPESGEQDIADAHR